MEIMDTLNGHDQIVVDRINKLHSITGDNEMLEHLLQWLDDTELTEFSEHLEDILNY